MGGDVGVKVKRFWAVGGISLLILGAVWVSLFVVVGSVQAAPVLEGSTRLFLTVTKSGQYASVYTLTNLSAAAPASTCHKFFAGNLAGGQVECAISDSLAPLQSKVFDLSQMSHVPNNFVGTVLIVSDQPISGSVSTPPPPPQPAQDGGGTAFVLPTLPDQVEVNWRVVSYIIIGLFALSGYFKGWWKEAITTFFLAILVFFLAAPAVAQRFIEVINYLIEYVWGILSRTGLVTSANLFRLEPNSRETWLAILMVFIGLAIFISRASLSNQFQGGKTFSAYVVTPLGGLLGGILGGVNGYLVINLVSQYLEGTRLPGIRPVTEIAMVGNGTISIAPGVALQVTNLPNFTVLDPFLPGIIIFLSTLIALLAVGSGAVPWGYIKYSLTKAKDKDIFEVSTITVSTSSWGERIVVSIRRYFWQTGKKK